MKISRLGLAFIAGHEGFVSTAYRDPVGVLTIGYGFTMRSRIFSAWWKTRHGRALRLGDAISRTDADAILARLVDEEYGAAVRGRLGDLPQHQHDAACSVAYNLGPRALTWRWARALKAGDAARAAAILRDNYNTARGRKLPGLVRRRREEAHLLLTGRYPGLATQPKADGSALAAGGEGAGMLAALGYAGTDFTSATRAFQRDHPPLAVDGLFGPKTRAVAERRLRAKDADRGSARRSPGLPLLAGLLGLLGLGIGLVKAARTTWRRWRASAR
ncbi:lysozyme [Stappia stellulata]|uniref:lysozyme n=1 Tax=Stappia stellulata TaxID=71235 RepID=UPI000422E91C|nr:lysozyme [Stappia stellulata]